MGQLLAEGHFLKEDAHARPLLHRLGTGYAAVGAGVDRGYEMAPGENYGKPTRKLPGDDAAEMQKSVYQDTGFVLKNRGNLVQKSACSAKIGTIPQNLDHLAPRGLVKLFSADLPANKSLQAPAGTVLLRGEGVKQVLATGYGEELPNFDVSTKVIRNLQGAARSSGSAAAAAAVTHGAVPHRDADRPVCLGGRGAVQEDMADYRRK